MLSSIPSLQDEEEDLSNDASVIMYKYLITINYIIEIIYVVILTPICLEVIFRRLLIKLAADCTFKFYSRFFKQVDR